MLGSRQIRSVITGGKARFHPYIAIILVYLALLVISHLAKLKLRPVLERDETEGGSYGQTEKADYDSDVTVTEDERSLLVSSFKSADFDGNKFLSSSELAMAISRQTKQHIMHAMKNNFKVFFALDKGKKNGQVEWDEYYSHYLVSFLGLDKDEVESVQSGSGPVSRDVKESISRLKAAWYEAARTNPDAVNIDEFLSLEEAQIIYDTDGDAKISRAEYLQSRFSFRDMSPEEQEKRGKEFDLVVDINKNGVVERKELIQFMDPKHQHWARYEADYLVAHADTNGDGSLQLNEVLSHPSLFLNSTLIHPEKSLHGEL